MITNLALYNFRVYEDTDFRLSPGLNLILGGNGRGKSTFVEGFRFALWGPKALRADKGDAVRDGTIGGSHVRLAMDSPVPFQVTRDVDRSSVQLSRVEGDDLTTRTEVDRFIQSIFGNYDMFLTTFVAMQGDVDRLARAKPAQRRDLLLELLGLKAVDRAIVMLRDRLRGVPDAPQGLPAARAELPILQQQVGEITLEYLQSLQSAKWQLEMVEICDPERARQLLSEWNVYSAQVQESLSQIAPRMHALSYFQQQLGSLQGSEDPQCPLCQQPMENAQELIGQYQEEHAGLTEQYQQLQAAMQSARQAIDSWSAYTGLPPKEDLVQYVENAPVQNAEEYMDLVRDLAALELRVSDAERAQTEHDRHAQELLLLELMQKFRSRIIAPYFRHLESVVSGYLPDVTPFRQFRLSDSHEFLLDGHPVDRYSYGQTDLFCCLLRIALARVLSESRYGKCPFLLLDSCGDSLSEQRFRGVMELLQTESRDAPDAPIQQVIVTSHHRSYPSDAVCWDLGSNDA